MSHEWDICCYQRPGYPALGIAGARRATVRPYTCTGNILFRSVLYEFVLRYKISFSGEERANERISYIMQYYFQSLFFRHWSENTCLCRSTRTVIQRCCRQIYTGSQKINGFYRVTCQVTSLSSDDTEIILIMTVLRTVLFSYNCLYV